MVVRRLPVLLLRHVHWPPSLTVRSFCCGRLVVLCRSGGSLVEVGSSLYVCPSLCFAGWGRLGPLSLVLFYVSKQKKGGPVFAFPDLQGAWPLRRGVRRVWGDRPCPRSRQERFRYISANGVKVCTSDVTPFCDREYSLLRPLFACSGFY